MALEQIVIFLISVFADGLLVGTLAGISLLVLATLLTLHFVTLGMWNVVGLVSFNAARLQALVTELGSELAKLFGFSVSGVDALALGAVIAFAVWTVGLVVGYLLGRSLRARICRVRAHVVYTRPGVGATATTTIQV